MYDKKEKTGTLKCIMIGMVVPRYPASIANYFTYDFTRLSHQRRKSISRHLAKMGGEERNEYMDTRTGYNRTNEGSECDMNALMRPLLTATRFVDSTLDPSQGRAIDLARRLFGYRFFFSFYFFTAHIFSLAF